MSPTQEPLIFTDTRVAYLLFKQGRDSVVTRMFALPKEDAALVTAVAALALAEALHGSAVRLFGAPGPPTLGDTTVGAAALNVAIRSVAGPSSDAVPFFGVLVALALLEKSFRPALRGVYRRVRATDHRLRAGLEVFYRRTPGGA